MNARRILLALSFIALGQTAALAQQGQQLLGQFNDWSAYTAGSGAQKVCFVISQPKSRAPEGLKRDPGYFFITHRPGDKVRNEVSAQVGFPMKAGSTAGLTVAGANFALVTSAERAWSNGQDDGKIVDAMRRGTDLVLKSTSGRGNVTTDTYSLKGISAALDRINQECR